MKTIIYGTTKLEFTNTKIFKRETVKDVIKFTK